MNDQILKGTGLVRRHSIIELFEHWGIALSGLVLLFTGLFELPIAKRYFITEIPGLAWSGDFILSLKIHYLASIPFIALSLFHVVYHGLLGETGMIPRKGDFKESILVIKSLFGKAEEPPFHKYLPEQRLAYAGIAIIIAGLIISGLVKTYKNIYAPDMSYPLVMAATWAHNIFFVLFFLAFLAHMAAIVIKPNRPMVRAIFTGYIRLDYARHRHPLWMQEIEKGCIHRPSGSSRKPVTDERQRPEQEHPKASPGSASEGAGQDEISGSIRICTHDDLDAVLAVINDGAQAYRGVIPEDRWKDPYMEKTELEEELTQGVEFWGFEASGRLLGIMGIQDSGDVSLLRHAYVLTGMQGLGIGTRLAEHLETLSRKPVLVGTWADASWAVRFYEKHGYTLVSPDEKDRLLRQYWSIPERQIETSVVLGDSSWFGKDR